MMKHIFEDALIAAGGISLAAVVGVGAWKVGWQGATLAIGGAAAICMIWNACIMKRDAKREAAKNKEDRIDKDNLVIKVLKDADGKCLVNLNVKKEDVAPEIMATIASIILSAEEATGDPLFRAKILTVTSELLLKDHDALSRMITTGE